MQGKMYYFKIPNARQWWFITMIRCDGLWPGYATCDSKEDFQPGLLHIASELSYTLLQQHWNIFSPSLCQINMSPVYAIGRQQLHATIIMTTSYRKKRRELDCPMPWKYGMCLTLRKLVLNIYEVVSDLEMYIFFHDFMYFHKHDFTISFPLYFKWKCLFSGKIMSWCLQCMQST